ncbi:MAG: sporulation protein YtfJ [Clostridia bacterium]|nr:sporulation protein YtfJ [Clostridia bacterium]
MIEGKQKHPIEDVITDTLKNIKDIIDIDTVVGSPVKTESNNTIIPISKVIVGYLGGGGEYYDTKVKKIDHPFALGSGAGMCIKPIGFLIEERGIVRYIETESNSGFEKVVSIITDTVKSFKLSNEEKLNDEIKNKD